MLICTACKIVEEIQTCECLFCAGCRITVAGREYLGTKSVTVSGRQCQPWSSSTPHVPSRSFVKDANFPDGSVAAAENYCRNPEPGYTAGVWCYTTDPKKRWEACDVRTCDTGKQCIRRNYRP